MNQTNELDAAYAARATARASAEQSAATLARAQRLAELAGQKVADLERQLADLEAAQAERLAAAIAVGRPTSADVDADGFAAGGELAAAKFHAGVTQRAIASIKAAHAQRQAELQTAERSVVAEVDKIIDDESIEIAKRLHRCLDEAVMLGKSLLIEAIGDEMSTRRQSPEQVKTAIARLEVPLIDRLHIAVNLQKKGDLAAIARRDARRAALISGESAQTETASAA
jgi:hypothetical protein